MDTNGSALRFSLRPNGKKAFRVAWRERRAVRGTSMALGWALQPGCERQGLTDGPKKKTRR